MLIYPLRDVLTKTALTACWALRLLHLGHFGLALSCSLTVSTVVNSCPQRSHPYSQVGMNQLSQPAQRVAAIPRRTGGGTSEGALRLALDLRSLRAFDMKVACHERAYGSPKAGPGRVEWRARSAFESAERIRLRVPVHIAESGRERKPTVLRSLMVRERDVQP